MQLNAFFPTRDIGSDPAKEAPASENNGVWRVSGDDGEELRWRSVIRRLEYPLAARELEPKRRSMVLKGAKL
jgi:hypothetical protein